MPPDLAGVQKGLLGHEVYSRMNEKKKKNWAWPQPQELPEMNHCGLYPNTRSFKTCHRPADFLRNIQPDMTTFGYVSSLL